MSLIMPQHEWPGADQAMWVSLRKQGGPLDEKGPFAHLRETSLKTLRDCYGRWLGWIRDHDPDGLRLEPALRCDLQRLKAWLSDLAHTAPMTQLMFLDGVLRILRAVDPDMDWAAHLRLLRSLKPAAKARNQERKVGRVLSSDVLLAAGLEHATKSAEAATTTLAAMTRRRDGALVALLSLLPMRRRALANLQLGSSVLVEETVISIVLSPEMTKTGIPWEADVPDAVEPILRHYIEDVRPWFMARGNARHGFLWVSRSGNPMDDNYTGLRVAIVTRKLIGVSVPPHFFRDAAATTLARHSPAATGLIQPVLGHTSTKTAERHYIHARTIEAGRDYAEIVQRLRSKYILAEGPARR